MKLKTWGFTLIEMLVVISIIGILASVSALAYTSVTKQSRDARRKTDLEQLRGALEQYRSNSATNSYPSSANSLLQPTKYIESIPQDPKTGNPPYAYVPSPAGCDPAGTPCVTYQYQATLENPPSTLYTVTPYGSTTAAATPTPGQQCVPEGGTCTGGGNFAPQPLNCCSPLFCQNGTCTQGGPLP